jgi:exonuclease III
MRIISVNLNGIRAAARKNFFNWLTKVQVKDERFSDHAALIMDYSMELS